MTQPMAFCWDDRGRMWIAENRDYESRGGRFSNAGDSRILILEDTDGDGKADKSTVFADDLNIPLSFEFGNGGVYVSDMPHLTFLKDTDGDDRADHRETERHQADAIGARGFLGPDETLRRGPAGAAIFDRPRGGDPALFVQDLVPGEEILLGQFFALVLLAAQFGGVIFGDEVAHFLEVRRHAPVVFADQRRIDQVSTHLDLPERRKPEAVAGPRANPHRGVAQGGARLVPGHDPWSPVGQLGGVPDEPAVGDVPGQSGQLVCQYGMDVPEAV